MERLSKNKIESRMSAAARSNSLLREFQEGEQPMVGKKIEIQGISPGKDVYNITAPFNVEEGRYMDGGFLLPAFFIVQFFVNCQ